MFKENLWAKVAIQVKNCQTSSLKDSQAVDQWAGSILQHAGIFIQTKRGNIERKKSVFNFVERACLPQPEDGSVTTRGATV